MANRDIIVIGASTGGLQALLDLLAPLPTALPAAIFVVVHTSPDGSGLLPAIIGGNSPWPAAYAVDGAAVEHGRIYIARPDHHLLLRYGKMNVSHGPRENRFRPAVDPLFRTAARAYGARVIGIVLSGGLDDGTHGLELIKRHGGLAIAQDPEGAVVPSMPLSAIQNVEVDHILAPSHIGMRLPYFVRETVEEAPRVREDEDVAEGLSDNLHTGHVPGPPSPYTCPECGGALWELEDGRLLRFRCHVGHSFTAGSLTAEQADELEHTLWSALRALEEQASLRRRMAQHAEKIGRQSNARAFEQQAKDAEIRAATMRRMLLRGERDAEARMPDKAIGNNTKRAARAKGRATSR